MRNLILNIQALDIQIEHFTNFQLQNNLQMFVILINSVNT